jgi:hypothetical protein
MKRMKQIELIIHIYNSKFDSTCATAFVYNGPIHVNSMPYPVQNVPLFLDITSNMAPMVNFYQTMLKETTSVLPL